MSEALARFAPPELVEEVLSFLDRKIEGSTRPTPTEEPGAEFDKPFILAPSDDPAVSKGDGEDGSPQSPLSRRARWEDRDADASSLGQISRLLAGLADQLLATEQALESFRHNPLLRDGPPSSVNRPIGDVRAVLEDVKARGFRPRGLVDVGANTGDWTRMATAVFPGMPYLLIEPQHEMAATLTALASAPGCHFINAGAAARSGQLVQTIWEDLGGSSFLPPVEDAQLKSGRQRPTRVVAIDSLLTGERAAFQPDLVKLDVQGFELEALRGGRSLFGRTELFILETSLFEFMPRQPLLREVIQFMFERGYEIYDITEYGRRPHDGALGQVDVAFVKADGFLRQSNAW